MSSFMGCAIWAYKDWVGDLYPAGSRASDFLRLYGQRFTAVEGNTTFYSVPDAKTAARWASETPNGFQFCLKLPRDITHTGSLDGAIPRAIAFLHQMQPLGDRLGPFFAQLPPSYSPDRFNDLLAFLQSWPGDRAELALEVRHLDWFKAPHAERLNDVLAHLGMGRVLLDTRPIYDCPDDPQLASERRKPKVPLQPLLTADFSIIRYISHPDRALNDAFLDEWVGWIDPWLRQGKRLYIFVHCPVEARSPANARHFQTLLEQAQVPVSPLPWNLLQPETSQLSLF